MSAVPNQRDWSKGELVAAATLNDNIQNPITFYRDRPMFLGSKITNSALGSSGGYADLTWNLGDEFVDNENMLAAGNTFITVVRPGLYDLSMLAVFDANAAGVRRVRMGVTRFSTGVFSTIYEHGQASSGAASFLHAGQSNEETTVQAHDPGTFLATGDRVFWGVGQNSGSTLNVQGAAGGGVTWACARWVAAS